MRNLKKILALVLALVMSLSLMATAGAASFQDVTDDNPYKTAIDVLDELKVFQGFEDGTFKPDSKLNRAQAAVLVYRIATGDVESKYVANYTDMAQSKFNDLDGYNWARGYINYCQNAKIVVGTSDTTFTPGAEVTGYQLMVMLLRTLGYGKAGEFADPKGWELETAKIAEREGILKNVTGGNFGDAAPRQMVAEILFQGLLQETVQHSALTPGGYTKSGEILGKNVGLEEITGVVTANEIADLDDTTPLEAGKTRLEAEDGRIYTLDVASAATDIGETRHAYIQNGTKVLGVLADTGNNKINDNPGVGTTLSKVVKDMNVRLTDDTQYYINFGDSEQYACERRLEYSVTFDNSKKLSNGQTPQEWFEAEYGVKLNNVLDDANTLDTVEPAGGSKNGKAEYTRIIPAERNITEEDLTIMRGIFSAADGDDEAEDASLYITGYVFAGTNSKSDVNRNKDLSEDISWREFYRDYINPAAYNISSSDNGEWFKVIDNDNDGDVDFVLLTRFVMTTITDYNSRTGYYTTEWTAESEEADHTKFLDIHKDDIVSVDGEDLAIDDVILYAKIDGKYYVDHPDTVDTSITKFNYKTSTITCADEQDRVWSGIDKEAKAFFEEITDPEMVTKRPYTLYLDHFNYVRLVTDTSKGFVLLTDGYYETNRRDEIMKATVYDLSTEKLEDVTVVKDAGESAFYFNHLNDDQYGYIDDWEYDHNGNRGTWKRLSTFGQYRYGAHGYNYAAATDTYTFVAPYYNHYLAGNDPFWTNVALASVDNGEYSLSDINDKNSRRAEYNSFELNENFADFNVKSRVLTGIDSWDADGTVKDTVRINTDSTTRYYWVTFEYTSSGAEDEIKAVQTWVGNNSSDIPENFSAVRAYAITSDVESTNNNVANYKTAEIVVFEGEQTTTEYKAMIPYAYALNKLVQGFGWDGEGYSDEARLSKKNDVTGTAADLFKAFDVSTGDEITENFGKWNIWAGRVVTSPRTGYYQFSRDESIYDYANMDPEDYTVYGTPVADFGDVGGEEAYSVTNGTTGNLSGYSVKTTELALGDRVIYFVDGKGNALLVIDITRSADNLQADLVNLWNAIILDHVNYQNATIRQMCAGTEVGRVYAEIKNKTANFSFTDLVVTDDGGDALYDWDKALASVTVTPAGDTKKEIVNNNTLRISGLKGGEIITVEYGMAAGKLMDEDNGPIELHNLGGKDADGKKIYDKVEVTERGGTPTLSVATNNNGRLEADEQATLWFELLNNYVLGTITIDGDEVAAVATNKTAATGYTKYKVDFDMPKANATEPLVIVLNGTVGKGPVTAPDVTPNPDGSVSTTIDKNTVQDVIANADAEGKVTVKVEESDATADADAVKVGLPADTLTALTDAGVTEVTVDTPKGSVSIPTDAISAIEDAEEGVVVVVAEGDSTGVNDLELTAEEKAKVVVVDVTLTKEDGTPLNASGLDDNPITVIVPTTIANKTVVKVYHDNEGTLEFMAEATVRNGKVTFTTPHLSTFALIEKSVADDKVEEPVPSTIVDFMSRDDKDTALAEATYNSWEFGGAEKTAAGLDAWMTTATNFVVDKDTHTITFTGTARAIDPTDFSYKNSEIGKNTEDYIPYYGYKDYAYYCVVGTTDDEGNLVGKGGKAENGTDNVEGYFTADDTKKAAFGDKYAIIGISETAEGSEWTRWIIVGDKQSSVTRTVNGVTWTITLDLTWDA